MTVTQLNVVPVDRSGRPQENVIAYLEELLHRARAGEVQSIITAWVQANGKSAFGIRWGERLGDYHVIGTALLTAQHEFMAQGDIVELPKPEPVA